MSKKGKSKFENRFIKSYEKYYWIIVSYINKFVYNIHISEELAQESFCKIYKNKSDIEPDSKETRNFLYTVARNTTYDYLRRKKNEYNKIHEVNIEEVTIDKNFYDDIENCYIQGEVVSTLHDTINSFPEEERDLFIKKNFQNESILSINRKQGISIYKIKKIENKIIDKLRNRLSSVLDELIED